MESILTSIKKMLGISEEYTHFDSDLIIHINSVFMILSRIGVGPTEGFKIIDDLTVWEDFIQDSETIEAVKSYMYLKVKLIFDPPLNSSVLSSMKELISELEWSLSVNVDPGKVSEV